MDSGPHNHSIIAEFQQEPTLVIFDIRLPVKVVPEARSCVVLRRTVDCNHSSAIPTSLVQVNALYCDVIRMCILHPGPVMVRRRRPVYGQLVSHYLRLVKLILRDTRKSIISNRITNTIESIAECQSDKRSFEQSQ